VTGDFQKAGVEGGCLLFVGEDETRWELVDGATLRVDDLVAMKARLTLEVREREDLASACQAGRTAEVWELVDVFCTAEVRPSLVCHVLDQSGGPLPGAAVGYRVDGGELLAAQCLQAATPPSECADFVAGYETPGEYLVAADKEGFQSAERLVRVEMDGVCHVATGEVSLALARSP